VRAGARRGARAPLARSTRATRPNKNGHSCPAGTGNCQPRPAPQAPSSRRSGGSLRAAPSAEDRREIGRSRAAPSPCPAAAGRRPRPELGRSWFEPTEMQRYLISFRGPYQHRPVKLCAESGLSVRRAMRNGAAQAIVLSPMPTPTPPPAVRSASAPSTRPLLATIPVARTSRIATSRAAAASADGAQAAQSTAAQGRYMLSS
jgi:hypothetical protein